MTTTELEVIQGTSPAPLPQDLSISRPPDVVLAEAKKAAQALRDVITQKDKPVIFNGEQYLEYEDWQLVGRFYGVTARVRGTHEILVKDNEIFGYKAVADAVLTSTGAVIGCGEGMCTRDEERWNTRPKYEWRLNEETGKREKNYVGDEPVPLFQLLSMAQTRAGAKALRSVLSWVVVLAGYRPTPAEEMTGNEQGRDEPPPRRPAAKKTVSDFRAPERKSAQPVVPAKPATGGGGEGVISDGRMRRFYAIYRGAGIPDDVVQAKLKEYGYTKPAEIRMTDYDSICAWAELWPDDKAPADYDDSPY